MPCYRCGSRQVDPERGPSPWQRGVRHDRQILICPECQVTHDWRVELDCCGSCGGHHLVSRLGEVECKECGRVRAAAPPATADNAVSGEASRAGAADLAEEVAQAVGRVLGKPVSHRRQ